MEVMKGCSWCSVLVLADPMTESVSKVNGESVGDTERDVCRSTEGEG